MRASFDTLDRREIGSDALRQLRAIMVLERIGNQEAREALTILAKGAGDARLTREAKAALERARR